MKSVYAILILFMTISCQDAIEVDVPTEAPRLIIDALIRINEDEVTTTATIKANLTSSFFENNVPANLSSISIVNPDYVPQGALDLNVVAFSEIAPGVYEGSKNTSFFTEGQLQLLITHNDQRYLAQTEYQASVPIDVLEQGDGTLFSGSETEIVVAFTDAEDRNDFYLFDFDFEEYLVTEDEFYPGQTFRFSYFYEDGLATGQVIEISLLGVEESFFNYMNQLIVQAGGDQGPFQTPAATVRGNIFNITEIDNINSFDNVENSDNFPLGYFSVSQEYRRSIVIE